MDKMQVSGRVIVAMPAVMRRNAETAEAIFLYA